MALCCIGGVCIPYSALLPLCLLGLKWIWEKLCLLFLGRRPETTKSSSLLEETTTTTTTTNKDNNKQRRSSKAKATTASTVSTTSSSSMDDKPEQNDDNEADCSCCGGGGATDTTTTTTTSTTFKSRHDDGPTMIASESEWKTLLQQVSIVVVKMTAVWCQPCKNIDPYWQQLIVAAQQQQQESSGNYTKIGYAVVDVDALDAVAAQYQVAALPTFLAIHTPNNAVLQRYSGSTEAALQAFFQKVHENKNK
ncbi:hypothetical protein ACA910_014719 [Epithemia clementina (nom. ined.)]